MKTCIIAIARLEGEYIREWVEYHLNLGFEHIFIADNNFDNKENLLEILSDYIINKKVSLFDERNIKRNQYIFYNDILYDLGINQKYDWCLYIDIDEFLVLNKHKNVNDYLSQEHFKNFDIIKINWKTMTDGGHLINTGKPVLERMTIPAPNYTIETTAKNITVFKNQTIKSFIRTKLYNKCPIVHVIHTVKFDDKYAKEYADCLKYCYNDGTPILYNPKKYPIWSQYVDEINHNDAYIMHFQTKTVEEYVKYKMARGWSCFQHDYQNIIDNYVNKDLFFSINGYSPIVDKLFNEYLIKYNIKQTNTTNAVS